MARITIQSRIDALRRKYEETYDLSTINSANDASSLQALWRNTLIVEDLQTKQLEQMEKDTITAKEFKDNSDMIKAAQETIMQLEKSLGIDRKSRQSANSVESPAEYIAELKKNARDFLQDRLIKVYCPDCNVLVCRYSAVHEHTAYEIVTQCSQCGKAVRAMRKERDVLFDLKPNDRAWRAKYPAQIVQSKKSEGVDLDAIDAVADDEVIE